MFVSYYEIFKHKLPRKRKKEECNMCLRTIIIVLENLHDTAKKQYQQSNANVQVILCISTLCDLYQENYYIITNETE